MKIGEFLLNDGRITPEQLQNALDVQKNPVNWEAS